MGRETVETQVTETVTQEVILCDACGAEAKTGDVILRIDRAYWDQRQPGDALDPTSDEFKTPLYRCEDCRDEQRRESITLFTQLGSAVLTATQIYSDDGDFGHLDEATQEAVHEQMGRVLSHFVLIAAAITLFVYIFL